ncbi:hypothetical protein, partial [Salmonella enterica]|uniref:hypothetical protein n=1 Tax=Salmonella enterica TaxID=28901 RepID=UPI0015CBFA97
KHTACCRFARSQIVEEIDGLSAAGVDGAVELDAGRSDSGRRERDEDGPHAERGQRRVERRRSAWVIGEDRDTVIPGD